MIVRGYEPGDYQAVVDLLHRLHEQTIYSGVPIEDDRIADTLSKCIGNPMACAFLAVDGKKIVGILIGVCTKMWWTNRKSATDLVFYSEKPGAGRKLAERFLRWCEQRQCVKVTFAQSSGMDPADEFYSALGFKRVGSMFVSIDHGNAVRNAA